MNRKVQWITQTAVMLALLLALQTLTKPMGQLVTGSCVNAVLAIAALVGGLGCGITVAAISPILAFLLGIAPQILTVPAIMVGNAAYVVVLCAVAGKDNSSFAKKAVAWVAAAVSKFVLLYAIVAGLICNVFSQSLLATGVLKAPMLKALPATFGVPQLITALIGGGVAMLVVPALRRALKRK